MENSHWPGQVQMDEEPLLASPQKCFVIVPDLYIDKGALEPKVTGTSRKSLNKHDEYGSNSYTPTTAVPLARSFTESLTFPRTAPSREGIETSTAIGLCRIHQPIESCFDQRSAAAPCAAGSTTTSTTEGTSEAQQSNSLAANRSFSNAWIRVASSPLGGYGVFAAVDIPKDTHILVERPMIWIKNHADLDSMYARLEPEEKLAYDSLHPYHMDSTDPVEMRFNSNCFIAGVGDGCFAVASNFNHACDAVRNTGYLWDPNRRVMTFTVFKAISKGEELFISYGRCRDAAAEVWIPVPMWRL